MRSKLKTRLFGSPFLVILDMHQQAVDFIAFYKELKARVAWISYVKGQAHKIKSRACFSSISHSVATGVRFKDLLRVVQGGSVKILYTIFMPPTGCRVWVNKCL